MDPYKCLCTNYILNSPQQKMSSFRPHIVLSFLCPWKLTGKYKCEIDIVAVHINNMSTLNRYMIDCGFYSECEINRRAVDVNPGPTFDKKINRANCHAIEGWPQNCNTKIIFLSAVTTFCVQCFSCLPVWRRKETQCVRLFNYFFTKVTELITKAFQRPVWLVIKTEIRLIDSFG